MRIRSLLLAGLLAFFPLAAQDQRHHSAEALRGDWRALREALETYHAGLYLFTAPAEYEAFFEEVEGRLDRRMSDLEFFSFVARAVEMTHERHTRIGVWTGDRVSDVINVFRRGAPVFPLELLILDDGVYVWRNGSDDDELARGTRLLSIDGRPIEEVIDALRPYVVADGYNAVSKSRDIQRTFSYLYYWFVDRPQRFRLKVIPPGGEPGERVVGALTTVATAANRARREGRLAGDGKKPAYSFEVNDETSTVVLALTTFDRAAYGELGESPAKVYARLFHRLRRNHVRTLILDLRGNAGGRVSYVRDFVPFLLDRPRRGVLYTATSYTGRQKRYRLPRPDRHAFRGRWIVLVDGGTWSAGSQLAAFAREYAGATIVGEETAGRYDGNTGGSDQEVLLPNTAIEVRIPRWRFDFGVSAAEEGRGVLPDHTVVPTLKERIAGLDPALEFARRLAR